MIWPHRTVNVVILPLALCWQHDLMKPFLRQTVKKWYHQQYPNPKMQNLTPTSKYVSYLDVWHIIIYYNTYYDFMYLCHFVTPHSVLITPPLGRRGGMDRACRRELGGGWEIWYKKPKSGQHPEHLGTGPPPSLETCLDQKYTKTHNNQYKTMRIGSPRAETLGNWSQWSE